MKQVAIALDQLVNTLFGGWADETISARLYRNKQNSWYWSAWYKTVNKLFFWQTDHCLEAYKSELARTQYPKFYREMKNG